MRQALSRRPVKASTCNEALSIRCASSTSKKHAKTSRRRHYMLQEVEAYEPEPIPRSEPGAQLPRVRRSDSRGSRVPNPEDLAPTHIGELRGEPDSLQLALRSSPSNRTL